MIHASFRIALILLATGLTSYANPPRNERIEFFEKKIRPVLVKHCYQCHSAKSKELGGNLMLDSRDGVQSGGQSGPSLDLDNPNDSLLIKALQHDGIEMPPDKPLPASVVNDFMTWIKLGAADPRFEKTEPPKAATEPGALWSFEPRTIPTVPSIDDSWPRDPIDQFVLKQLEIAKLQPTRDASPITLVRRLYHDLTGLPPTYQQTIAFTDDFVQHGQQATMRLVDELLDSHEFGRRWGRHWLDAARYGESNGDDGLGRNATFPHAWRYRDWVIDAINQDVPYDRFLTEQIAGDLLPATDAEQRNRQLVATGFLAIGSKPAVAMNKNFAMDVVDDQINAVCTVAMGLSVACARCHDHKHDPIPTRDYYALAGIFSSTETLYGLAANEKLTAPPTALHELRDDWPKPKPAFDRKKTPAFPGDYATKISRTKPIVNAMLTEKPSEFKQASEGKIEFTDKQFAKFSSGALQGELPAGNRSYTVSFWLKNTVSIKKRPITAYPFSRAKPGKDLLGDHLGIGGKHDLKRTGKLFVFNGNKAKQSVSGTTVLPKDTWNHIVLIRDQDQVNVYLNGVLEIDAKLPATFGDSTVYQIGRRSDGFAPLSGNIGYVSVYDRAISSKDALGLHAASGQPKARKVFSRQAMGVRDKPKPINVKIHVNGDISKLGPVVPRGFLTAYQTVSSANKFSLSEKITAKASGRLQLARWLTDPDHPQTARVAVNRIWQHLFGQGIVRTVDDFGVYGARPSHPELLDHLANRFVANGWSVKRLIRTIVLSRTYQLSSFADPETIRSDPNNVLLARHARRRLDAESFRDNVLHACGSLDHSNGIGSAVQATVALINWPAGQSTDLHRPSNHRSIYLCMLRHAPPKELAAFDLPDGVSVTGQRSNTTLPTQSLFLLNSEFVVGQSLKLAKTLQNAHSDDEEQVNQLFRLALARLPSAGEYEQAIDHLASMRRVLDGKTDSELRALASLCQAVLVSNEFRYLD